MYGFGDDQNPYTESVELLEDLVIEFITDMTHKAMEIGRTGRVQVEDIVFLVRKDPRKYASVKDLLTMNEELKKARKAFDEVKYAGLLALNLSYNQLTGLERAGLAGLHSLEVLDLSHNRLAGLATHGLPHLHALVQLKMDDNQLCNIYGSPFQKMSRLRVLSLRNNKMTSLSEETFKPLRHTMYALDVDGNPLQCSCGMMWLQSWLREAPYLAMEPRCQDGTYLRQMRISQADCSFVRYDEPPVPGCERAADFGGEFSSGVSTTSSPQTIPSALLSHFIPGDTPTLYVGTKTPTPAPGPGPAATLPPTRQPSSAFTFFGMPLPSLGSFWGAGRDSDGRGRFTSSRGRGRVQQLPPTPQDGFRPMTPHATGGFRPIFNPYNNSSGSGEEFSGHSQSLSLESPGYNHLDWDNSLGLPHTSVSKVPTPVQYPPSSEELDRPRPLPWDTNLSEPLLESGGGSDEYPCPPPTFPPPAPDLALAISLPESSRRSGANDTRPNKMGTTRVQQPPVPPPCQPGVFSATCGAPSAGVCHSWWPPGPRPGPPAAPPSPRCAVSNLSYRLLDQMAGDPLFNINDLNPSLYNKVRALDKTRVYRIQLHYLKDFVNTCRFAQEQDGSLQEFLRSKPPYFLMEPHVYSIQDLKQVKVGELSEQLRALVQTALAHVDGCVADSLRPTPFCQQRDLNMIKVEIVNTKTGRYKHPPVSRNLGDKSTVGLPTTTQQKIANLELDNEAAMLLNTTSLN